MPDLAAAVDAHEPEGECDFPAQLAFRRARTMGTIIAYRVPTALVAAAVAGGSAVGLLAGLKEARVSQPRLTDNSVEQRWGA